MHFPCTRKKVEKGAFSNSIIKSNTSFKDAQVRRLNKKTNNSNFMLYPCMGLMNRLRSSPLAHLTFARHEDAIFRRSDAPEQHRGSWREKN